jgi:hypothetical protein
MGYLLNQFHGVNHRQPHTPLLFIRFSTVIRPDYPKAFGRRGNRVQDHFFHFNGAGEFL